LNARNPLKFSGDHYLAKIPATEKRQYPTRCCVVCCTKEKIAGKELEKKQVISVNCVTKECVRLQFLKYFIQRKPFK